MVLVSWAPWPTMNPLQHVDVPPGYPRLVVLIVLPFVAENRGPARLSVLGALEEFERRRVSTFPAVFKVEALREMKGAVLVLCTWLLSPMNI